MNNGIRVLSCNLWSGRADAAAFCDIVTRENVDIVCAQELSPRLATVLGERLTFGDLAHDQLRRGNGIASRLPVETGRIRMPKRDGRVVRLSPVHWQALTVPIEIVDVHISGPHLWPYFPHPVRRRAQLDALLANRAESENVPHAIFGDFNASPAWPVYRRMAARYTDGILQAGGGTAGFRGSWPNFPALGIRGLLRIDHCFLWQLRARAARLVDIPGSDHFGLLVDLSADAGQAKGERKP